ncbi:DEAD/DEAH box helicase family protein [bacterium]|nr:DEAD/DEAH box helicase family protein [bacterium]
MRLIPSDKDEIVQLAAELNFSHTFSEKTGYVFQQRETKTCLIIDTVICNLDNYYYVDYTSHQNKLFHENERVLRFLHEENGDINELKEEILFFLQGEDDVEKVTRFGRDRTKHDIDPTQPEAEFEDYFIEAFGESKRVVLHREFSYVDGAGTNRYVDYALFTDNQKYAIEINGESFHHPVVIGPKKYRSQLFKQNSLSMDGFKVFRWSSNGMRDRESILQELRLFLGDPSQFHVKPHLRFDRSVKTITLYDHQEDALKLLESGRIAGRNTFLIVLPTGTGKTVIFIKDIERLKRKTPGLKVLILVPSRKLRQQTIEELRNIVPQYANVIGTDVLSSDTVDIVVQTSAYLHRHYFKIGKNRFDYIVIDEAHHAAASGLRRILEYFTPLHLLGVTATPERFDQQQLEEIFGEYESPLSLEEAIKKGLVPPVRCCRIESNIDLTEVRFNGKDYVKSDLQKTLQVPSRDDLVAKTLMECFSGELSDKQGVVFCVDIAHARRMSSCLCDRGIPAMAVSGQDRSGADRAQQEYKDKKVRFLCACDLLTEGWDAPQTSILVMARPTFSKVLYTQQLGRGLRNYPDKESLYVMDVVDNYGAKLHPMSLHALLRIDKYKPFGFLIKPELEMPQNEIQILEGLYEEIHRIEPVDIFNFENMYGDYLNEEQLARELFVSTGTVKTWLKKEKIKADFSHPFGRSTLHFFNPDQLKTLRSSLGLSKHTPETRKDDFMEFLDKRDYTFSYKIIFLLAFLKTQNKRGEAILPDILELYKTFYQRLLAKHGKNEKPNCPYNSADFLDDSSGLQRNLRQNPFEKFERKRFFRYCKDLNYIGLDNILREKLQQEDYEKIISQMVQDLKDYYSKQDIEIVETDYSFLLLDDETTLSIQEYVFVDHPAEEDKYKNVLPLFPLRIAAGYFDQSAITLEPDTWIDMQGLSARRVFDESMFVAKIQGRSMEPDIKDGSYCLFTRNVGGTRNGRIVLAQKSDIVDQDTGASYTIKKYLSTKIADVETGWKHETIILKPANPDYEDIAIPSDNAGDFAIIAFFMEVLQKL